MLRRARRCGTDPPAARATRWLRGAGPLGSWLVGAPADLGPPPAPAPPGCLQARTERAPARTLDPTAGWAFGAHVASCGGLRPCKPAHPPVPTSGIRFFSLLLSSRAAPFKHVGVAGHQSAISGRCWRQRCLGLSIPSLWPGMMLLHPWGGMPPAPAALCFFPVFPCLSMLSLARLVRTYHPARHPVFPYAPAALFALPAVDRRHRGGNTRRNSAAPPARSVGPASDN